MQKYIATLFLLVLLLPVGIKVILVADYALRYDYYTTVLCENKDKVEMACHGKCQLNKNLVAASEFNHEAPTLPAAAKSELAEFIINQFSYNFEPAITLSKVAHYPELQFSLTEVCMDIPTPPPSL